MPDKPCACLPHWATPQGWPHPTPSAQLHRPTEQAAPPAGGLARGRPRLGPHLAQALDEWVFLGAQSGGIAVAHGQVDLPAVAPECGRVRGHPGRKQPGGTAHQQEPCPATTPADPGLPSVDTTDSCPGPAGKASTHSSFARGVVNPWGPPGTGHSCPRPGAF